MENTTEPREYRVPEANMPALRERIAKLAKRAAKLHVAPPSINVLRAADEEITKYNETTERTIKVLVRVHYVTITGQAPKIAGWTFGAVLQPTTDESGNILGNILRVVPGFDSSIPERYRAAGNNCDHCHTSRRRNETYVLVNESGEWKQVGRNCLRDFLGHQSPEALAAQAEMLIDAAEFAGLAEEGDFGGGSREAVRFDAEEVLTLGACAIRLYGFVSNKVARDYPGKQSTSAQVIAWIDSSQSKRDEWEHPLNPTESDKVQAAEVLEWIRAINPNVESDYMYNLSLLGRGATFTYKNFGLAISAIAVWAKEQEREINRKKRFEADSNSEFVGTVGKREVFKSLTLVYTQTFENDWGVSHLYKFKSPEGNVLVWFSGSILINPATNDEISIGAEINLKATVKAHETRDGVKQTKLTRGAIDIPKPDKKLEKFLATVAWG